MDAPVQATETRSICPAFGASLAESAAFQHSPFQHSDSSRNAASSQFGDSVSKQSGVLHGRVHSPAAAAADYTSFRALALDEEDLANAQAADQLVGAYGIGAPARFVQLILSCLYKHVNPDKIARLEQLISNRGDTHTMLALIPKVAAKYEVSLLRTFGERPSMEMLTSQFDDPLR